MKKLFALMLISLILLTSCADIDKTGTGSGEDILPFDVIVIGAHPIIGAGYDYKDNLPPTNVDYIATRSYSEDWKGKQIKDTLSYNLNIVFSRDLYDLKGNYSHSVDSQADVSGIIDTKEKFESFYEGYTTEKYSDRFPQNFFENNILFVMYFDGGSIDYPYVKVEYTFDTDTKGLNVAFSTRPHEGWGSDYKLAIPALSIAYLIPIAKSDITVDGKLVPYEELRIEVTGNLTVE
jgi:hypothetical protein